MSPGDRSTRVDIVIPHYNHAVTIGATVDSLLAQTVQDYRIIIVDDGSTDPHALDVLTRLAKRPCVEVLYQENRHVGAARNTGIRSSNSPYILVIDSDDLVAPTFLEECLHVLERHPRVGIVSSWIKTYGIGEWLVKPQGGNLDKFLHKNNCPGQAVFRRTCWEQAGGYKEELKGNSEDWEFYISVLEHRWSVSIVEKPLLFYYVQEVSANMEAQKKRLENYRRIIELHQDTYRSHYIDVILRKEEQLAEKFAVIADFMLRDTALELPAVTFGDSGMAFRVMVESSRREKSR